MQDQRVCLHNLGFHVEITFNPFPGLWVCNNNCGFSLNFNPEKFPNGIAYLTKPNEEKKLPKLKGRTP